MNNELNRKAAEILVECGYGIKNTSGKTPEGLSFYEVLDKNRLYQNVDPFSDTLEGRRQADAVEDWLFWNKYSLWFDSKKGWTSASKGTPHHQWRLDRIRWCLEQLEK